MNRWLAPFLVIGVVSTIALRTLWPLVLSIRTTADTNAVITRTAVSSAQQSPHSSTKTPLPPVASSILDKRHRQEATTQLLQRQSLSQLLAPNACYGERPAFVGLRPPAPSGSTVPPTPMAPTLGAARPDGAMDAASTTPSAFALALGELINQQRQRHGVVPLTIVPTLTLAAHRHSLDMATQTTPVHQGSDGSSGGGRMLAAGYQWQAWAEVIGWGFADPASMVEWWLNDAEHRTVLLSPTFTEFGIGYAALGNTRWQSYWTVNFGQPAATNRRSEAVAGPMTIVPPAPTPPLTAAEPVIAQPLTDALPTAPAAACPTTSTQSYSLIPMTGVDRSHPAPVHGDLNLAQRGYTPVTAPAQLIELAGPVDPDAPQLAQLFASRQPVHFADLYQVYDWDWQCGEHGCRGELLSSSAVTMLGLQSQPGIPLRAPARQTSIYRDSQGNDYVAVVLYAEAGRLTLAYTRDGSVANGYVVHLEQVCVDPNLVQHYVEADHKGRQQLPALQHNQPLGTAAGAEVRLAIRDRGTFLDPRSRKDWWQGF